VLHEYASLLGIPIEFSTNAVDYFETEDYGGVELADRRKLTADIVVAADGVGSKSWHLVGEKTAPISSGFVLYRVTFPAAPAFENPIIRKEFEGVGDRGILHAGPGAHMVTCLSGDKMCWMLTCKVNVS
jgi:2-polyprenyl-6-methoxyphenol hydroxylase-like FAD-dependent oxidoreductase